MAEFFNVVFAGEIARGADPAAVRANIGRLFKASDAMLEKLFSGQRIAVKKAVDQATAMKYRAVMKQAGAVAVIEEADAQGRPLAAASPAAVAPPAPPAPVPVAAPPARAPSMAERIAALAAEQAKAEALKPRPDAPPPPADVARVETWRLFPPGSLLSEARPRPAPMLPNVTHISLAREGSELLKAEERAQLAPPPVAIPDLSAIRIAPAGSDLIKAEEKPVVAPVKVDVSALSMAPPNTEVLKESEKRVVVPVVVDTSKLSVAAAGVDLGQIREEKQAVNPDTSRLKLA